MLGCWVRMPMGHPRTSATPDWFRTWLETWNLKPSATVAVLAERQAAGKPKATVALKISQSLGFRIGRAVVSCGFCVAWSCTKARSDQALCLSKSRKYRKTVAVTSQWIYLCQSHSIWTSESVWDYLIIEKNRQQLPLHGSAMEKSRSLRVQWKEYPGGVSGVYSVSLDFCWLFPSLTVSLVWGVCISGYQLMSSF